MSALLKAILYIMVSANLANLALSGKVPAISKETHIKIQNLAAADITTTIVSGINPGDWEDKQGPANNFQGVEIPAGTSAERREEVDYFAKNCPFTMSLVFSDGTTDTFSINQKYAIGKADANFQHTEGTRKLLYSRTNDNYLLVTVQDNSF